MLTAKDVQKRLGRRLREHRERVGLTQVDLAESVGLDASTVRALEAGRRGASLHVIVNVAAELGIAPGELLEPLPGRRTRPDAGRLASQLVDSMEPAVQQAALELLKVLKKRLSRRSTR